MNHAFVKIALAGLVVLASTTWVCAQAGGGKGGASPRDALLPFKIADCTVEAIDVKAMTFTCGDLSIGVSASTVFQFANVRGSFSDLKVGKAVEVSYKNRDSKNLADSVTSQ